MTNSIWESEMPMIYTQEEKLYDEVHAVMGKEFLTYFKCDELYYQPMLNYFRPL
jgi:hypothetical protein